MFKNRFARGVLVVAVVGFAWMFVADWATSSNQARWIDAAFSAGSLLLAIGIAAPVRARWALRVVAGAVGLSSLVFFVVELRDLLEGNRQVLALGHPSATTAGIGLLVYGVPLLIFAVSGFAGKRWRSIRDFIAGRADTDNNDPAA
ncbi:MAG TPA: hypothetical protein VII52_09410 [Gemmatimonadaceae bacterium]